MKAEKADWRTQSEFRQCSLAAANIRWDEGITGHCNVCLSRNCSSSFLLNKQCSSSSSRADMMTACRVSSTGWNKALLSVIACVCPFGRATDGQSKEHTEAEWQICPCLSVTNQDVFSCLFVSPLYGLRGEGGGIRKSEHMVTSLHQGLRRNVNVLQKFQKHIVNWYFQQIMSNKWSNKCFPLFLQTP